MFSNLIVWHNTSLKPHADSTIIAEDLNGLYYIDEIGDNFGEWSERAMRWGYISYNKGGHDEKTKIEDLDSVLHALSSVARMSNRGEFSNYILRKATPGFLSELGKLYQDFCGRSEDDQRVHSYIKEYYYGIDGKPVRWEHRCDGEVFHEEHRTEP